ncbi:MULTISPECIES: cryptochrome/photolyase family protein [unclassified Hyphomonas]|uniref:cryptochrome/photolyase family protein n=1 Tax=unclassified Hyphomonas TaxID=2630699 RepID=UPI000C63C751|nr:MULTISPECIES: deoxyribodipyrimidine photo-lyase [unclassified Hyphomonas]MAA83247.1 deoxyribodipyrimidine photolyase [Hyphomonas sp.]MAN92093.1 deoxyribodipyrimidine photolyase [Hyphomonadaceae bacterium]
MSQSAPAIVWFREDLRLSDNPALHAAVSSGRPLVLLYILDEQTKGLRPLGGASKWWLDKSLRALAADIKQAGAQLTLRSGQSADVLDTVIEETGAETIFWNRRYDQPERDLDAAIKEDLTQRGLDVSSHNARLLNEPWQVETNAGGYYKVFTPYWRAARNNFVARDTYGRHKTLSGPKHESESLDDWGLHPSSPDWSTGFDDWTPGEDGAIARLTDFLDGPINGYKEDRNRPDLDMSTSGLSPHLRFGEIGPLQIWRAVHAGMEAGTIPEKDGHTFLSEIGWREFSHTLLFYNPALASENYNDSFEFMPWRKDKNAFDAWTKGQTGYPMVDAGMRQLWQTGWMHNRVRMIVASFLTKHLLLPWQDGEAWFWDTLVDADPANNAASWQWTAGSGADAAPYFRVFNPISQGSKFDETGAYVRRFCPELKDLPDKYLHAPWEASEEILNKAGIQLGKTYPKPIVDHSGARQRALDAYDTLKEKRDAA